MLSEAAKRKFVSSASYFKATIWEGKSLGFKLKYAVANHPEISLGCFVFLVVAPAICYYRFKNYDTSKYKTLEKYRIRFTIVRDDDPDIEQIKAEKEYGREFVPKY